MDMQEKFIVSRSSAEAEYQAMARTCCELSWLIYALFVLHVPHPQPIDLYCNNQKTIHIFAILVFHKQTEHIELDCHLI